MTMIDLTKNFKSIVASQYDGVWVGFSTHTLVSSHSQKTLG